MLWDIDGHRYVDFLGEFTAGLFGHSRPRILASVNAAMASGLNLSAATEFEVEFAERIHTRFPSMERLRLTNSGTEANLMALTVARAFTGRDRILVFEHAYHGGPMTFLPGQAATNLPFDVVVAPYNDLPATLAVLAGQESSLAAVLIEPMQGAGGCVPGDPAFLAGLRNLCDRSGAVLIFDEVMTSRLHPGGMQAALGICPDLTTLGKWIGGGLPCGAFGGRSDIMDLFDPTGARPLPHAGTFNNNALTMHAGIAAFDVYTPQAAEDLNARGDAFRDRLNAICADLQAPFLLSGFGAVMALHCNTGHADSSRRLAELVFFDLIAAGFHIARRGLISLNLAQSDAHLDAFTTAFSRILTTRSPLWRGSTELVGQ